MYNKSSRFVASNEEVYRISVVNSKGGSGKTTFASNLSVYLTYKKYKLVLADYDRQKSSYKWLQKRPSNLPHIFGISNTTDNFRFQTRSWKMSLPQHTDIVIQDTAAGLFGHDLENIIKSSNLVIIPVVSSAHDIRAAGDCINEILQSNAYRTFKPQVFVIANRVNRNSLAFANLENFINKCNLSILAVLNDNKSYSFAAENGVGFHEIAIKIEDEEILEWKKIGAWIEQDVQKSKAKHTNTERLETNDKTYRNYVSRAVHQPSKKDHRTEDQLDVEEEKPHTSDVLRPLGYNSQQHSRYPREQRPGLQNPALQTTQQIPSVVKQHLLARQQSSLHLPENSPPLKAKNLSHKPALVHPQGHTTREVPENHTPNKQNQTNQHHASEGQNRQANRINPTASPLHKDSKGSFFRYPQFQRKFTLYPKRDNSPTE